MTILFPETPSITFYDPLADLLGAGDGLFHYIFDDAVRLSGHACPTVAGAFLMTFHAVRALYGDEMPRRGEIHITIPGAVDTGTNGPISQVFTLLTGAAATNGFQGLNGRYGRQGLLDFSPDPAGPFLFRRTDNGEQAAVQYDPSCIPPDPGMMPLLQRILRGDEDPAGRRRFRDLWRGRVIAILTDAGERTVTITKR